MDFIILEEVDSTNSYVALHAEQLADMTMVAAETQTAGRGQRGNTWESEPGRNLTATLLFRPVGIAPRDQFSISEATALAVTDWLRSEGVDSEIKWPNDIYVGGRKICGILIEHSVTSSAIEHSRIGFGININQRVFLSDAPNPVSMYQLTGVERDVSRVAAAMGACLERRLRETTGESGRKALHEEFLQRLWRREGGPYPFRRKSDGYLFSGEIEGVEPEGPIVIRDVTTGECSRYYFKEVEFIPAG